MNDKKARLPYEAPELNVIRLMTEDVITNSPYTFEKDLSFDDEGGDQ